jgi:hypothetical protein
MKILPFKLFKKYNKISFKVNEIVRRKSDNRLGVIMAIDITNNNKSDELYIYWFNSNYKIDDFILEPNPNTIVKFFRERNSIICYQDEIKKIESEEQDLIDSIDKYNL